MDFCAKAADFDPAAYAFATVSEGLTWRDSLAAAEVAATYDADDSWPSPVQDDDGFERYDIAINDPDACGGTLITEIVTIRRERTPAQRKHDELRVHMQDMAADFVGDVRETLAENPVDFDSVGLATAAYLRRKYDLLSELEQMDFELETPTGGTAPRWFTDLHLGLTWPDARAEAAADSSESGGEAEQAHAAIIEANRAA